MTTERNVKMVFATNGKSLSEILKKILINKVR